MEKIVIKELVSFRRKKTEKSKKNFAYKLKTRPAKIKVKDNEKESPRDYWVTSTSCIYNVFKDGKDDFYDPKIEELQVKIENTEKIGPKSMHQRNKDILLNFKEFEINQLRPENLKREKVSQDLKILNIDNFPLFVNPNIVFSFEKNGKNELGALWLVPQLDGFKKSELGIFCEALYRFLLKNFSDKFQISTDFCIAIDTFNAQKVVYTEILNGDLPLLIDKTLDEIKAL